jgi:hypothetical protein
MDESIQLHYLAILMQNHLGQTSFLLDQQHFCLFGLQDCNFGLMWVLIRFSFENINPFK